MWRRSPVTTLLTVYRHPILRQPLRQPLLATFFQAISLYPEHLRNSCSGRSGRASQPVPATLAPVRSPETSEPEPGGGSAPRAQTPRPPAIWPSCVRVRRPGPAPAPSQPHPAASRSRLRSPIRGPSPHHALPSSPQPPCPASLRSVCVAHGLPWKAVCTTTPLPSPATGAQDRQHRGIGGAHGVAGLWGVA